MCEKGLRCQFDPGCFAHWQQVWLTIGMFSTKYPWRFDIRSRKTFYGLFLITLLITIITLMGMESAD